MVLVGRSSWCLKFKIKPINICKGCSTKGTIQWHQQNVLLSLNAHSINWRKMPSRCLIRALAAKDCFPRKLLRIPPTHIRKISKLHHRKRWLKEQRKRTIQTPWLQQPIHDLNYGSKSNRAKHMTNRKWLKRSITSLYHHWNLKTRRRTVEIQTVILENSPCFLQRILQFSKEAKDQDTPQLPWNTVRN